MITLVLTLTKEMIVQVLSILNGTKKNNNVSHETKKVTTDVVTFCVKIKQYLINRDVGK